jgi:radical SAM superfamily enzyme YgiQ (UPF0313 family)
MGIVDRIMKVILIQPPIQDFYDTDIRLQPLGLCMLKGAVKKHLPFVEVLVRDYHHGHGRRTLSLPRELSYLNNYYAHPDASPFCAFHHYYHFGAPFDVIAEHVVQEGPDLVGISALFTPYHREALGLAREIKDRVNVPVIVGGSHVSAMPETVLSQPEVDFVIRGEGERPLVEFLKALEESRSLDGVPNLGYKAGGRMILNPTKPNYRMDDLPLPDFTDLPPGRYLHEKSPICFVTTSRGCPHQCTFCSAHTTFGKGYRARDPEAVLSELEMRYSEGYRVFDFEDDNLSFDRNRFRTLLKGIRETFAGKDVRFFAMNGLSYLSLDRELLGEMRAAGFTDLNLSLVTHSAASLSSLRRPHRLGQFLEVIEAAAHLGFRVISYQILGLPMETRDQMVETMALLTRLPVRIGASIFYLTPGSVLSRDFPPMTEPDMFRARSTAMALETDAFTRDDLYTLFLTARIINFLKSIPMPDRAFKFRDALNFASNGTMRERLGAELLERLMEARRLHAATRAGLKFLVRFNPNLFLEVLDQAGEIRTLSGARVFTCKP